MIKGTYTFYDVHSYILSHEQTCSYKSVSFVSLLVLFLKLSYNSHTIKFILILWFLEYFHSCATIALSLNSRHFIMPPFPSDTSCLLPLVPGEHDSLVLFIALFFFLLNILIKLQILFLKNFN